MSGAMTDRLIDARGLLCPLPVLKLRKTLLPLAPGDAVFLWADDPVAVVDVPHFCAETGHEFCGSALREGAPVFHVIRGK